MSDLSHDAIVILGISSTVVFGTGESSGVNELMLCHLGSGLELALPVTDEQAHDINDFYLSTLGRPHEGGEETRAQEGVPPPAGPPAEPPAGEVGARAVDSGRVSPPITKVLEL